MLMKNKFFKYPVIIAAGCAILISGMTIYAQNQKNAPEPVVHRVESHADRAVATDVQGLVQNSDYIVVGHYDKFVKKWEVSTDPYTEGDIYNFVVDEILYGDVPETIEVGIPHFQRVSAIVDGETYSADITEPHHVEPNFENQYILFLKKYEPLSLYTPAAAPYQVEIDSNDKAALKYSESETKKISTKKNEIIEFSADSYGFSKIDKITGKSGKELKAVIKELKKLK